MRIGLDARGLSHVGYDIDPEFLAEGKRGRATSCIPTASSSARSTPADCDAVAALYDAARREGRAQATSTSAEMIKLAANAFLMTRISLHQRDRERLEAYGRGRRPCRGWIGPRPPSRAGLPARGDRIRRKLLPEGLARAEAARLELRLPLPAPDRGNRGERAAEAAGDREARSAISARFAARRSRCSGSRSSRTPTTCARHPRSCSRAACSPRAPRCAPGIRSPTGTRCRGASTSSSLGARGRRRPPTRP